MFEGKPIHQLRNCGEKVSFMLRAQSTRSTANVKGLLASKATTPVLKAWPSLTGDLADPGEEGSLAIGADPPVHRG